MVEEPYETYEGSSNREIKVVVRKDDAKTMAVKITVDKVAIATRADEIGVTSEVQDAANLPGLVARPTILVRAKR